MKITNVPFGIVDWDSIEAIEQKGITGIGYRKTVQVNDITMSKVEYTPGYVADHWCAKGHILFVVEGTLIMEMEDGEKFELTAGMSYHVADDITSHRSCTETGVKIIVVD